VSALEHVINGVTTIQEAIRVAQQFETDVPMVAGASVQEVVRGEDEDQGTDDAPLSLEALN
jgi:glycerol-3-phosphate dehydrogenase